MYCGLIELLLQLYMHPFLWYPSSHKMFVEKMQSLLLLCTSGCRFFNEPLELCHRCVPADLQKGLALSVPTFATSVWTRCLCSNRWLRVCSCVYVSTVFVLYLPSMPACCLNRFVERTSRWYCTGFKFEHTFYFMVAFVLDCCFMFSVPDTLWTPIHFLEKDSNFQFNS